MSEGETKMQAAEAAETSGGAGADGRPEVTYDGWLVGDPLCGTAESLEDAIGHIEVALYGRESAPLRAARERIRDAMRKLEAGEAYGPTRISNLPGGAERADGAA